MVFVRLHVLTKFCLVVSVEVHLAAQYDFRWALRFGDVTLQGKHVTPEHSYVYHFCDYNRMQGVKREYVVIAVNPVFDGMVISLDL